MADKVKQIYNPLEKRLQKLHEQISAKNKEAEETANKARVCREEARTLERTSSESTEKARKLRDAEKRYSEKSLAIALETTKLEVQLLNLKERLKTLKSR